MKPNVQLAIDNDDPTPDPFADLLEELVESGALSFDGEDPDEPITQPITYRHQLLHMDFWFLTGGLACQLAIMTSFIPLNAFEPLVVATIALLFMAVVSNLTREKQGIIIHELRRRYAVNFRWPWNSWVPPNAPLVERVKW